MRRLALCLAVIGLSLAPAAAPAGAQEGHPLTGTWSGDWGPSAAVRTHITMVMAWDGKVVTGTINPGPDAVQVDAINLDVTNWAVRFEALAKDGSGTTRIAAEGTLRDLASPHRTLTGSWTQGSVKGDFTLTRD